MEKLQTSYVSIINGNIKCSIGKWTFATNFKIKLFRTTIANANIWSLKSLSTLFDTCFDHMLVKFEQNQMVRNMQNFELCDRKPGFLELFFVKAFTPFWKTFLKLKQLLNTKLLICRLPSFSVPNIAEVRHM